MTDDFQQLIEKLPQWAEATNISQSDLNNGDDAGELDYWLAKHGEENNDLMEKIVQIKALYDKDKVGTNKLIKQSTDNVYDDQRPDFIVQNIVHNLKKTRASKMLSGELEPKTIDDIQFIADSYSDLVR